MRRRSRSVDCVPFDPEIEATCRRNNRLRRQRTAEQQSQRENMAQNRPFGEMGIPSATHSSTSCITKPTIDADNFELRPHLIQMIERNQFGGSPLESPNDHLSDFLEKCDTIVIKNVSDEAIRLRLFPFSLRDKAKTWLKSEPANKYSTWDALATGFLTKFFPPSKTSRLRTEIQTFKQNVFESYYEAWERFKDLMRQCPHHQIPNWLLVQSFYSGIHDDHKASINSSCNGDMNAKSSEQLLDLFEKMAQNSFSWSNERSTHAKSSGAEGEAIKALTQQVAMLAGKLDKISTGSSSRMELVCELCCVKGHSSDSCPQNLPQEEVNALYNSNTYNHNPRDNLSYRNPNVLKPQSFPPHSKPQPYRPPHMQNTQPLPQNPSLESMFEQFMASQIQTNNAFQASISQLQTHNKMIETQLAQLAQQVSQLQKPQNHFPSQPEPSKQNHQQLHSISVIPDQLMESTPNLVEVPSPPRVYIPSAPFPRRIVQSILEKRHGPEWK